MNFPRVRAAEETELGNWLLHACLWAHTSRDTDLRAAGSREKTVSRGDGMPLLGPQPCRVTFARAGSLLVPGPHTRRALSGRSRIGKPSSREPRGRPGSSSCTQACCAKCGGAGPGHPHFSEWFSEVLGTGSSSSPWDSCHRDRARRGLCGSNQWPELLDDNEALSHMSVCTWQRVLLPHGCLIKLVPGSERLPR